MLASGPRFGPNPELMDYEKRFYHQITGLELKQAKNRFQELIHSERAALLTFYSEYKLPLNTAFQMSMDAQTKYLVSTLFRSTIPRDILEKITHLHNSRFSK